MLTSQKDGRQPVEEDDAMEFASFALVALRCAKDVSDCNAASSQDAITRMAVAHSRFVRVL